MGAPAPLQAPDTIEISGAPAGNEMVIGDSLTLSAVGKKAGSSNGVDQGVSWSSSDEGVASINGSGLLTAIGAGTTTITATSTYVAGLMRRSGGAVAASFVLTVSPVPVVYTIELNKPTLTLVEEQTEQLIATVKADNVPVPNPTIVWSVIEGSDYLDVEQDGTVEAYYAGSGKVRATFGSGEDAIYADCMVTINPAPVAHHIEISVAGNKTSLVDGESVQLTADVVDADGVKHDSFDQDVMFSSESDLYVEVDEDGLVTAILPTPVGVKGVVTVMSLGYEDMEAQVEFAVTEADYYVPAEYGIEIQLDNVAIAGKSLTLDVDAQKSLTAYTLNQYGNEFSAQVSWSSSDPESVSVTNGNIKVLKYVASAVRITASADDGSDYVDIVINNPDAGPTYTSATWNFADGFDQCTPALTSTATSFNATTPLVLNGRNFGGSSLKVNTYSTPSAVQLSGASIWNLDGFGVGITKVTISTMDISLSTDSNLGIKFGTSANPTSGSVQSSGTNCANKNLVFVPEGENMTHFVIYSVAKNPQFNSISVEYTDISVPPDAISITGASTMLTGGTTQLTATLTNNNSTEGVAQNVTWSIDSGLATVEDGLVRPSAAGSVVVRATSVEKSSVSTTKTITVSDPAPSAPETITILNGTEIDIQLTGSAVTLTAEIKDQYGVKMEDEPVSWEIISENIGIVFLVGNVVSPGSNAGHVIIQAKATNEPSVATTIRVNVVSASAVTVTFDATHMAKNIEGGAAGTYATWNGPQTLGGIECVTEAVLPNSTSRFQFQASNGFIGSTTALPGKIISVTIEVDDIGSAGKLQFHTGSDEINKAGTASGAALVDGTNTFTEIDASHRFFAIGKNAKGAAYITSITIVYMSA